VAAQLCDFGISVVSRSRAYTFCGTPEYIAPEVLANKGATAATDGPHCHL
jgi:protein kinase A